MNKWGWEKNELQQSNAVVTSTYRIYKYTDMCSHMYVYMDILLSVSIYLPGGTGHEYFSVIAQCIIIWDRYILDGVYSAPAGLGVVCSV